MVAREELGRLFDGDTSDSEVDALLQGVYSDGDLRECWTTYGMLSDALVGVAWPDDCYSQRIIERLRDVDQEPSFDPLDPKG